MSAIPKDIQTQWARVGPLLSIRNEHDYALAVKRLNRLVDEVGTDEQHPLYDLLDVLGTVVHAYEEKHYPLPKCSGPEILQFLMAEHGLTPSDLPELGSPALAADILAGKHDLDVGQIRTLARRFHVSPAVFIAQVEEA